jgi:hypothetical protein
VRFCSFFVWLRLVVVQTLTVPDRPVLHSHPSGGRAYVVGRTGKLSYVGGAELPKQYLPV